MENKKGDNKMNYEIECRNHNNRFTVKNPATKASDVCHVCKMEKKYGEKYWEQGLRLSELKG